MAQTMKKANSILAIALLVVMTRCGGGDQSSDDLIIVDVTKNYSKKKELILQDFMDVEYIKLETNDDFLNQGIVADVGKEIILVTNQIRDGDIFVYDRTGKALRKINRKGQKISEEYTSIFSIILDEDNEEMFINDVNIKKIYVYDLFGNFKRSFDHKENVNYQCYTSIFNYDSNNLICYDDAVEAGFNLISKKDGSIKKEINIQFKKKKYLRQLQPSSGNENISVDRQIPSGFVYGGTMVVPPGSYTSIIPYFNNWILLEYSSDTIYQFLPDLSLRPFIVRIPSIQSMTPEIMLILTFFSERFLFFETVKNEYDFIKKSGFPRTYFMYDKNEKVFSQYILYSSDYSTKKEIYLNRLKPVNHDIESWQPLQSFQLVDDYKKGILKGQLKEIASKLDEEDNPVVMLIKHKM